MSSLLGRFRIGKGLAALSAAALMGLSVLGSVVPAEANNRLRTVPIEIKSENIIFYGDVDPALAKERVEQWEVYRKMVYALSGIANPPPDPVPLTIYAFNRIGDLQDFTGNPRIGGVYTQGIDGPIFLTSVNQNYREGDFSEQTGFHEYTHHILHAIVKEGFPRWYDEGFANYLATMKIEGDTVIVGDPSADHLVAIKERRADWISPETVLSANAYYPNYTRREARKGGGTSFYGQSTLYVHYLRSKPEYNAKLPEYLDMLERPGVSPIEAFEETYGLSIDEFHKDAVRYFRNDEYVITAYQPGPAIMETEVKMRRLSEEELAKKQIPARMSFLNNRSDGDFRRDLMKAYEKYSDAPIVGAGLVRLEVHEEKYDQAVDRAESRLAANPSDRLSIYSAAYARATRSQSAHDEANEDEFKPYPVDEDVKIAISRFKSILEDYPTDYNSAQNMILIYGMSEEDVTDEAFQAARMFDTRYMDKFNPYMGLALATIYAKRGFTLDACDYYVKAVDDTSEFSERQMGTFTSQLEWFKTTYGESCQLGEY